MKKQQNRQNRNLTKLNYIGYRIIILLASLEKGAVTESQPKLFSVDNSALYCCYYYSLRLKLILFFILLIITPDGS